MSGELIELKAGRMGGQDVFVIDAREVYRRLGVRRHFKSWIKGRIEEHGFEEGQDFEVLPLEGINPQGVRPTIEYNLTIIMARDLSMIESSQAAIDFRRDLMARMDAVLKAPVKLDYDLIIELATKPKIKAEERGRLEARLDADALDHTGRDRPVPKGREPYGV
ncbi:MAG: antA/AntB antirepressor family protein [Deltaproteobacteria bacterium]|jgi:phage anti-repressor protein|nr:antA/AntB antirepressor family protein [Deltaproteobacteria bacterium]